MKNNQYSIIVLIFCICTCFLGCHPVAEQPEEQISGEAAPSAMFVVVKFDNPEQLDNVIVQHPIKQYNGDGFYEYDENAGLFLNILKSPYCHTYSMDTLVLGWLEREMHIAGTSPYIPLSKGYYMIDWKWQQLMPITAGFVSVTYPNAYFDPYMEHIHYHVFMKDMKWEECNELTAKYDTISAEHLNGVDITRIKYEKIVAKDDINPYTHLYQYQYQNHVLATYILYQNGNDTYQKYITYCDSLQDVYQERLIEIIDKGQLKEIGLR